MTQFSVAPGLALGLGVKGFSIRLRTSSSESGLDTEDIPQQALMDLYAVTGQLVINWGMVEMAINAMSAVIYHEYDGKTLTPQLKKGFARRMASLKRWFKDLPRLTHYADAGREFRSQAKQLAFVRQFIAHGYLSLYDPETKVYTFRRLDLNEDNTLHREKVYKATAVELMATSQKLMALTRDGHNLCVALLNGSPR